MPIDPLSAGAVFGGGLLGAVGGIFNNERNLAAQREAQDYNKWAQQVTWQREDNAVQRRRADMEAAGFHPTLAVGNAAQAGSPTKIDPVMSEDGFGTNAFMSGVTRAAQSQQSIAAAEAAKTVALMNVANINKIQAEADKTTAMSQAIKKEWGLAPGTTMVLHPKNAHPYSKLVEDAKVLLKGLWDKSGRSMEDVKKRFKETAENSGLTPAERAKKEGKWHLFNQM